MNKTNEIKLKLFKTQIQLKKIPGKKLKIEQ